MGVNTEGNGQPACRGTRKRSLVISPNLDKLLEHEERSRRSYATTLSGYEASICPETTTLLAGLPPPPRRNRHCSTALSRRSSTKKADISSSVVAQGSVSALSAPDSSSRSRSSNPYINPAPTAEELFLSSSHDSAHSPGPSQQSIRINDQQQNASLCSAKRCFRAQTLAKGKFAASPILRMFANSDNGRGRTCISDIPEEDTGVATGTDNFFGISSPTSMGNKALDPNPHRMSVKPRHLDPNLDNRSSSHLFSLSTTQPMASPPGSPTLECYGVKPLPKPVLSRHPSPLKKHSTLNNPPFNAKPATTNFLDDAERAELVRKSRKLARLFGETPNAEAVVNQAGPLPTALAHGKKSGPGDSQVLPPRPDGANTVSRRYSLPLRVDDMPSIDFSRARDADGKLGSSELCSNRPSSSPLDTTNSLQRANSIRSISPISFIDDVAGRTSISSSYSSQTPSIYLESERRRKRERLAKLYRFLGSQVPINLVLGTNDDSPASLPPRQQNIPGFDNTENKRNTLLKRRRSSSAIPRSSTWSDDVERLKADLNDREKAIIVRRAQKMEKLFGVAPPLTLYNSASAPSSGYATPLLRAGDLPSGPSTAPKSRKQKESRPATPESSRQLLPRRTDSFDYHSAQTSRNGHSTFYNHFEHSLNSLNDIIDRDDKAALAELHQALHGDEVPHEQPMTVTNGLDEGNGSTTPTCSDHHHSSISSLFPRSERRGVFPARTSMISLDSEYSLALPSPMPQASSFQQRRKRAAKLTHFFGVDYKELFDDVLESLEDDMQLGQSDGVLRAEEVEDLHQKLCKLKHKRQTFW